MKIFTAALLVIILCLNLQAEGSGKKYEKVFPKEGIQELVLSNQYGKIKINQTEGNEIKVLVNMSVTAKSEGKADETLEFISVRDIQNAASLNIETEFGKDMAIKQFISNTSLKIDYTVDIPKGIKLRIITSNGDVYLGNFEGEVNADVRNGDFKAGVVKGEELFIKQSKGAFGIEDVKLLTGEFDDCSIFIGSADEVKMVAKGCDAKLESIEKLNIRSSGGEIKLGEIEQMTGSSSMTKYEVQDIGSILDMDMKLGEINVRNIHFRFSEVRLKGSFTKVGLTFMPEAGYQLELKHNKALKMDLPKGLNLEERPTTERNKTVGTAFVGNKQYNSKVFLDLLNGNMYIQ